MMSKSMALRSVDAEVITNPQNDIEKWLLKLVEQQAKEARIGMPDVAIFESVSPNAFATGSNRNAALVGKATLV